MRQKSVDGRTAIACCGHRRRPAARGRLSDFALCASDRTWAYLSASGATAAICAFFVPYAAGSAWAVARPSRALWARPLVMLAAIAICIVVLALVEGGLHHCET